MDYETILTNVRNRIYYERNELIAQRKEAVEEANYNRAWSCDLGIVAMNQVLDFINVEEQAEMERQTAATQPYTEEEIASIDFSALKMEPVLEQPIVEKPVVEEPVLDIFDDELTWVDDYVESIDTESGDDFETTESLDDLIDEEL